jgi:DNA/RNA endonuclease YhcR with UshA esterase domain
MKKFKDIEDYEGKDVKVKGKIKGYSDKPEIILKSEKQIKIITKGK